MSLRDLVWTRIGLLLVATATLTTYRAKRDPNNKTHTAPDGEIMRDEKGDPILEPYDATARIAEVRWPGEPSSLRVALEDPSLRMLLAAPVGAQLLRQIVNTGGESEVLLEILEIRLYDGGKHTGAETVGDALRALLADEPASASESGAKKTKTAKKTAKKSGAKKKSEKQGTSSAAKKSRAKGSGERRARA